MRPHGKIVLAFTALTLVGVAAVIIVYEAEIRPIRAKVLAGGKVAETPMGQIEYAVAGTGTPLLSVHGAGGGYDQGLMIATGLVGEGFKVIAPSRFGYLRTPVPRDGSPAAQADADAALLDALGVGRAIVVGTSAGAPSAIQLALRHPQRVAALILLSPRGYVPGHRVGLDSTLGNKALFTVFQAGSDLAYWLMMHVMPSVVIRFVGVPPEVLDMTGPDDRQWANQVLTSLLPVSMRVTGIMNDSSIRIEAWSIERISAPTLIVTCSDDLFHTQPAAEYAAAHIPGARLVIYPTGGHLFIGRSAEVQSAVASFLKQTIPSSITAREPNDDIRRRELSQ